MTQGQKLPVLLYHHVSTRPGIVTLSPQTFREQIKWQAKSRWKTVTSSKLELILAMEKCEHPGTNTALCEKVRTVSEVTITRLL